MRIRSIKPEFCTDEKIGALSREERLHFILLWMAADREGTIEYLPRQLAAMLYPFDDDMEKDRFEALTSAVLLKSLCSRFSANGRTYLHITNFTKHQSLTTWERKESRVVLSEKSLRKYLSSTTEVLRSEERRGEESTEPPNPQGGLSEGEVRFALLLKALQDSGKVAESATLATLAVYWRNHAITRVDPEDQEFILHVATMLQGHVGRVQSLSPWLAARVEEFKKSQKPRATALTLGPSGGDM